MYNYCTAREKKLCNVHNAQFSVHNSVIMTKQRLPRAPSRAGTRSPIGKFQKEMAYEEDFSPFVPCGYSRAGGSKPDHRLRRCERWQDPSDVPDLGRRPARRYAGHVRRLHGTAPRRRHRGAGHQLGRVLDQAGSGHHGQTGPRHFLDAHQRDPEICRQRQAGGLLQHC